jgi:opacity protein-like surface antigen
MTRTTWLASFAFTFAARCAVASATDPLGLYIGAAVGSAHIRSDEVAFALPNGTDGTPLGFDQQHLGWKVLAGLRPISLVGAELEYIDFGHPSSVQPFGNLLAYQTNVHPKATTLFGVIYLPLPLPLFGLYGKAGVARLQRNVSAQVVCTVTSGDCPPTRYFPPLALSESDIYFAYGAGAQVKLSTFAVRLEYERISANGGDPDLFSLGVTWTF